MPDKLQPRSPKASDGSNLPNPLLAANWEDLTGQVPLGKRNTWRIITPSDIVLDNFTDTFQLLDDSQYRWVLLCIDMTRVLST